MREYTFINTSPAIPLVGDIGLAKFALDNGQSVNSVRNGILPLHVAAGQGDLGVVQLLLSRGGDPNSLRLSKSRNADEIPQKSAAKRWSNPIKRGQTALHFAAANGHIQVVKELLANGACPSIRDDYQCSPVDVAAAIGRRDIVDEILRYTSVWDEKWNRSTTELVKTDRQQDKSGHGIKLLGWRNSSSRQVGTVGQTCRLDSRLSESCPITPVALRLVAA